MALPHTRNFKRIYRLLRWRTWTGSSNNLARFSYNNAIPNLKSTRFQDSNIWPNATMDNLFYTLKDKTGKAGSTYNFAIITDTNVVRKPKWGYKAIAAYTRPRPTADDTIARWISKMAGNIQTWWGTSRRSKPKTGLYTTPYTHTNLSCNLLCSCMYVQTKCI